MECKCDARFSGMDEQEYCARGCPPCICKKPITVVYDANISTEDLLKHREELNQMIDTDYVEEIFEIGSEDID